MKTYLAIAVLSLAACASQPALNTFDGRVAAAEQGIVLAKEANIVLSLSGKIPPGVLAELNSKLDLLAAGLAKAKASYAVNPNEAQADLDAVIATLATLAPVAP